MSKLQVDTIYAKDALNAPDFPAGATVTGVVTATTLSGAFNGTTGTFSGNVTVGGTLTYDDVTNIDSVGLITAQGGINVSGGNVKVNAGIITVGTGVTISSDFIHLADNKKIQLGIASDLALYHNGSNSFVVDRGTGPLYVRGNDAVRIEKYVDDNNGEPMIIGNVDGSVDLYYDNSKKIETISTGASVYGGLRLQGGGLIRENVNISATALNSDKVINLSQGMVHYRSAAVGAANVKLNVISTAGINTDMAIGDALSITVITAAGNASHFVDQIRVDGVEASAGVTTHWVGGSAPTDGGASGVDTYAFNIIKTGNAAYLAVANKVATS